MNCQYFTHKVDGIALAAAGIVALGARFIAKTAAGPRHPTLTAEVLKAKWTPIGFVVGHFVDAGNYSYGNVGAAQKYWCRDVNRAALVRLTTIPIVLTANPEDIAYITTNVNLYAKDRGYDMLKRLLGSGLVTLYDNNVHAAHRREVAPAFAPAALKAIADECFPAHAARLLEELKQRASTGKPQEVMDPLQRAAMRIVAQAAFKTSDVKTLDAVEGAYHQAIHALWSWFRLNPLIDRAMVWQNLKVTGARKKMRAVIDGVTSTVLKSSLSGSGSSHGELKTLVDYLLQSNLTSDEIFDHSITLLFAGFDTTVSGLTWMVYHMATHLDVQDKLYEELASALSREAVPPLDTVNKCRYLFNCIRESLRYAPPVIGFGRRTECDDVLPGTKTFVPKGTTVGAEIYVMHTHPQIWGPDAEKYVPERWERPGTEQIAERAFAPFSWGRRNCVGKDFAMNEMKILAGLLFRNFRFTWPSGAPEPLGVQTPVVKPTVPFKVFIALRSS